MTKLLLLLSQGNYFCSLQRWVFIKIIFRKISCGEAEVPFTHAELGLLLGSDA